MAGRKLLGQDSGLSGEVATAAGGTREQIGARATALGEEAAKPFAQPARDLLRNLGLLPEGYESANDKGMAWAMQKVEDAAQAVEGRTGGKVKADDVTSLVTYAFGALGAKGVDLTVKQGLDSAKARAAAKELKKEISGAMAENQLIAESEIAGVAERPVNPVQAAAKKPLVDIVADSQRNPSRMQLGEVGVRATELPKEVRDRRRAEVRAAFAEDPITANIQQATVESDIARRQIRESLPPDPTRPRTGLREGQVLDLNTPIARPTTTPEGTPFSTAEQMAMQRALQGRGLADMLPRGEQGKLVGQPSSLDSGLAKTREGRLFDLTPEERIALKGAAQITNPKIATAVAVGATGLGLAMALEPDAEEAALAIGAGALVAGRGKGLTLEAIRTLPDAAPLGSILDQSAYTLNTLEQLPKNRFEI